MDVDKVVDGKGLLYLLEIEVEGKIVQKIGITRRKIEDRVVEILTSYFKVWRYFPYVRPKRYRTVDEVFKKEALLLEFFKDYKVNASKTFGGCTELVDVDLQLVVDVYEEVVVTGGISANTKKRRDKDLKDKGVKRAGKRARRNKRDDAAEMGTQPARVDKHADEKEFVDKENREG